MWLPLLFASFPGWSSSGSPFQLKPGKQRQNEFIPNLALWDPVLPLPSSSASFLFPSFKWSSLICSPTFPCVQLPVSQKRHQHVPWDHCYRAVENHLKQGRPDSEGANAGITYKSNRFRLFSVGKQKGHGELWCTDQMDRVQPLTVRHVRNSMQTWLWWTENTFYKIISHNTFAAVWRRGVN